MLESLREQNKDLLHTLISQQRNFTKNQKSVTKCNGTASFPSNSIKLNASLSGDRKSSCSAVSLKHLNTKDYNSSKYTDKYSLYDVVTDQSNMSGNHSLNSSLNGSRLAQGRLEGNSSCSSRRNLFQNDFTTPFSADTSILNENEFSRRLSDGTSSSTPTRKSKVVNELTPKSILKRRQLIDKNVCAKTTQGHSPISLQTPKRDLNFSYSNYMEDEEACSKPIKNLSFQGLDSISSDNDGSYLEERVASNKNKKIVSSDLVFNNNKHNPVSKCNDSKKQTSNDQRICDLVRERLLTAEGNDRLNSSVIRELDRRPKNKFFDSNSPDSISQVKQNGKSKDFSVKHHLNSGQSFSSTNANSLNPKTLSSDQRLLGYDWIAGNLDNQSHHLDEKSDDYFDSIKQFRHKNKVECESDLEQNLEFFGSKDMEVSTKNPLHTCIHGYTLNDRLFTEPVKTTDSGESMCPVCVTTRREPRPSSPGFVRVSIPFSSFNDNKVMVEPHRRSSYSPGNSFALAKHCVTGYKSARPVSIPVASSVDLRRNTKGVNSKITKTMAEAQIEANRSSKMARNINSENKDPLNVTVDKLKDINDRLKVTRNRLNQTQDSTNHSCLHDQSTAAVFGDVTDRLLDNSYSLRYQLNDLTRSQKLDNSITQDMSVL